MKGPWRDYRADDARFPLSILSHVEGFAGVMCP